ncbi:FdtA/QdtA family cupin domain-containing protein [Gammaproteobacteria bacterium]|nr:FdtA/QdtA family cupin domain-containing protein [Gammaproteobacteria bacterium]
MSLIQLVNLKRIGDERGALVAIEGELTVPFSIKRVYYIFDTRQEVSRGFHAHQNLQQIAVCIKGSCRFVLDDGKSRDEVLLKSADKGLIIKDLIWREMHDFSEDCVLLVLASEKYNENDYIRSYENFLKLVKNK